MMFRSLSLFALVLAAPVLAQQAAPPAPPPAEEGGLSGSVSDESDWQDLGIAIPSFATNADVPTQTSAGSTAALGRSVAQIITADLKNNGLFKPVGPDALPQPGFAQIQAPDFATWKGRSAEMLVQGYVRAAEGGQLTVGCYLYDVALSQQLAKAGWTVAPGEWRRAARGA